VANCRSCRIEIDWAQLPDGKPVPVDRSNAGDPGGNLAVRRTAAGTLQARVLKAGEQLQAGEVRGISHFASCPQAQQWRQREASRG
jgi:hypothetical protein